MRRILVTGGAGFLGSSFVRYLHQRYPGCEMVALDKSEGIAELDRLAQVRRSPGFRFVRGDVCDPAAVREAMIGCDAVVNLVAETSADRSLVEPGRFVLSDVHGTFILLEAALQYGVARYLAFSTAEVYGSCAAGAFRESSPLRPCTAEAASKAGAELLARAYHQSHGLCVVVARGGSTFGPYQRPGNLVPLVIRHALEDRPLILEGEGRRRDWLYVDDYCEAIDTVLRRGFPGEIYNVGSGRHCSDLELARNVLAVAGRAHGPGCVAADGSDPSDRCVIDAAKLRGLGWSPRCELEGALAQTVRWYEKNRSWWKRGLEEDGRDGGHLMEDRQAVPVVTRAG